jgi:hypothetical protein
VSFQDADTSAVLAPLRISAAQARGAAFVLAGRARDAAELRAWLEIIGLIPAPSRSRGETGPSGGAAP